MSAKIDNIIIRDIQKSEYVSLGQLMIDVYSKLEGFPTQEEQPDYYLTLQNIGHFSEKKDARVLVAISEEGQLLGGIIYFADMTQYGSKGIATSLKNTSGIRLLGVGRESRKQGVGKALTNTCINLAKEKGHSQVVLHTTKAMRVAWGIYLKLGFVRSADLDFVQKGMPVFGFRLKLE